MRIKHIIGLVVALAGCGVDPIAADLCGNHVVEPAAGEDCDGGPRPEHVGQAVTCAAVGQPNACRYTCDRTASVSGCPGGWACGGDGVCRHASGAYSAGASLTATGDLGLGDLDGDGALDLIASGVDQVEPLFNNGDGSFASGRIVPSVAPFPPATIGDLDGDGRTDVLTGTFDGFIQAEGQRSRTMLPVVQPSVAMATPGLTRVIPFQLAAPNTDPSSPNQHLLVIDASTGALRVRIVDQLDRDASGNLLDEIAPVNLGPGTLADVAGVPARADVTGDGADDIALVIAGTTSVKLLVPITTDHRHVTGLSVRTIPLPGKADGGGVRFHDLNVDGKLDLMVSITGDHVAVASGLGGGSFGTATISPFFDQLVAFGDAAFPSHAFPLAPIKLGTARAAWINDYGIFRDDGTPTLVDFNNAFLWTEAVVGDFNHDGLQDLAASAGKPTLDVFLQTPDHLFAHSRVVTTLAPSNLRVGDFDGDGADDLVYVEVDAAGTTTLSVAFGSSQGLIAPDTLGKWSSVVSCEPMSIYLAAASFRDGIDDLVVQGAIDSASAAESLTFMFGSYQRLMLAPYEAEQSDGSPVPFVTHALIGRFDEDTQADVAIVHADADKLVVSRARGTGRGHLTTPVDRLGDTPLPLDDTGAPALIDFGCSTFHAGDLDGDGRSDVFGLVFAGNGCTATAPTLVVGLTGAGGTMSFTQQVLSAGDRVTSANVDRDGHLELVVTATDPSGNSTTSILFREPDGTFAPVSLPVANVRSIAMLNADDDPELELAALTPDGVVVFDVDGRSFVHPRTVVAGAALGDRLLAGDLDGDRIDDLVIQDSSSGEAHAFLAVPHDARPQ